MQRMAAMSKRSQKHDRRMTMWLAYKLVLSESEEDQRRGFELLHAECDFQLVQFAERSLRARAERDPVLFAILTDIRQHAENVSQWAWTVIIRRIDLFVCVNPGDFEQSFDHWISAIVAYVTKEYLRGNRRFYDRNESLDDEDNAVHSESWLTTGSRHAFDDELAHRDTIALLWNALRQLRPDEHELIIQRFYYERSYREIAELMGRTEGALRVMWSRIKIKLRRLMDGQTDDSDLDSD